MNKKIRDMHVILDLALMLLLVRALTWQCPLLLRTSSLPSEGDQVLFGS